MCCKQVRRDPYWTLAHQTTQDGTLTTSGLLKCGILLKCRTQVRRDSYMTSLSSMMIWTLTPPQNRTFLKDHDHSCTWWMIDCERCWTVLQKMRSETSTNVLWFRFAGHFDEWSSSVQSVGDGWRECDKWRGMSPTLQASVIMGNNY